MIVYATVTSRRDGRIDRAADRPPAERLRTRKILTITGKAYRIANFQAKGGIRL